MKWLQLIMVLCLPVWVMAQAPDQWKQQGDEAWDEYDYNGAIVFYQKALNIDSTFLAARWQLAEGYRLSHQPQAALTHYEKLIALDQEEVYFKALFYKALMLKHMEQYTEASELFEQYAKIYRSADRAYYKRAKQEVISCAFANSYVNSDSTDKPQLLPPPLNSVDSEIAPWLSTDSTWYVASIRYSNPSDSLMEDADTVLRMGWYQLLNDSLIAIDSVFKPGNRHIANVIPSPLRKRVYYSLCHQRSCAIYYRDSSESGLAAPIQIEATQVAGYTTTQPYPTTWNGKEVLFFASNRPRGRGGMDIWYSIIKDGKKFGRPKNLGKAINTAGDELTPFYDTTKQVLYFSSDWHAGFGSYDVVKATHEGSSWKKPENLGASVNTAQNELYYKQQPDYQMTYWVSNRSSGKEFSGSYCCNDVYALGGTALPIVLPPDQPEPDTFFVQQDTMPVDTAIPDPVPVLLGEFKPVDLYFGNDQPDPRSTRVMASRSYDQLIQEYLEQLQAPALNTSFDSLQLAFVANYIQSINRYAQAWNTLVQEHLKAGDSLTITLSGYASPLASSAYNLTLSKRRIHSVRQYIEKQHGAALNSGQIVIIEEPLGERTAKQREKDPVNGLHALQSRKVTLTTTIKRTN